MFATPRGWNPSFLDLGQEQRENHFLSVDENP